MFLEACGFAPRRRQRSFQARREALRRSIAPVLERMMARGRTSADQRIVPFPSAPLDAVRG